MNNRIHGNCSRLASYKPNPGFSPKSKRATISRGIDISIPICEPRAEYATPCEAWPEINILWPGSKASAILSSGAPTNALGM